MFSGFIEVESVAAKIMAAPRPMKKTMSFRDGNEPEKLEGTGSWDAIEWTKTEVYSSLFVCFYLLFSLLQIINFVSFFNAIFALFDFSLFRGM